MTEYEKYKIEVFCNDPVGFARTRVRQPWQALSLAIDQANKAYSIFSIEIVFTLPDGEEIKANTISEFRRKLKAREMI